MQRVYFTLEFITSPRNNYQAHTRTRSIKTEMTFFTYGAADERYRVKISEQITR